jgi:hypothetical protein
MKCKCHIPYFLFQEVYKGMFGTYIAGLDIINVHSQGVSLMATLISRMNFPSPLPRPQFGNPWYFMQVYQPWNFDGFQCKK